MTSAPEEFCERSPIWRIHQSLGAQWHPLDECRAVVAHYGAPKAEKAALQQLALADLTLLARGGIKGKGCGDFVRAAGEKFPKRNNSTVKLTAGALVVRLSDTEVMTIAPKLSAESKVHALRDAWQKRRDAGETRIAFLAPRDQTHACFSLSGIHADDMMAKLCAVDLRHEVFGEGDVAQTSVARSTAVIIRQNLGKTPRLLLLFDIAQTEYFWGVLCDAMGEFNGCPVGLDAL